MWLAREGAGFDRNVLVILLPGLVGFLLLLLLVELIEVRSRPEFIVLSTVLQERHPSSSLLREVV